MNLTLVPEGSSDKKFSFWYLKVPQIRNFPLCYHSSFPKDTYMYICYDRHVVVDNSIKSLAFAKLVKCFLT